MANAKSVLDRAKTALAARAHRGNRRASAAAAMGRGSDSTPTSVAMRIGHERAHVGHAAYAGHSGWFGHLRSGWPRGPARKSSSRRRSASPSDSVRSPARSFGVRMAFLPRHGRGHRLAPHELPFRANMHAIEAARHGVPWSASRRSARCARNTSQPGHLVLDRPVHRPHAWPHRGVDVLRRGVCGARALRRPGLGAAAQGGARGGARRWCRRARRRHLPVHGRAAVQHSRRIASCTAVGAWTSSA